MKDQKQQRIAELMQNLEKYQGQEKQMNKRFIVTYNVMLSKKNDPSCSEEERTKLRQRCVVELETQSTTNATLLDETMELIALGVDSGATQRQCDLQEKLIASVRARIAITHLDLEATERQYTHFNSNAHQLCTAIQAEGDVIVDSLMKFMCESSAIYESLIQLHVDEGNLLHELKSLSPRGAEAWKCLTSNRHDHQVEALRNKLKLLITLITLSAKELGSYTSAALVDIRDPLMLLFTSHVELQDSQHYERSDRIAVLDDLIEHYETAMVELKSIGIFNIDELHPAKFNRLCEIVQQLHDDAVSRLTKELRDMADSEILSPIPTTKLFPAKRPPSSHSHKRVIHTVKGVLIGDVRPRIANQGTDIVDIKSPFEDQPLTSFHEHKPNVWVEIDKAGTPTPKTRATPYSQLKGEARKVLAKINEQMQKFESYAQGTGNPKGIEESLQNTAKFLTDYAGRLENHENAPSNSPNDAAFINELRGQAQIIYDKATQLRTQMSLGQAPTSTAVEYLLSRNEIHIQKNGERIQLKTGRQDFMQEFALLSRDNRPLWYAHFHYETLVSAKGEYTAASLKTKEQRFETKASVLEKTQSPHQTINIHRGAISKALADVLLRL